MAYNHSMKLTRHQYFDAMMLAGILTVFASVALPTLLSGWLFTLGLLAFAAGFVLRWPPWEKWLR